MLFHTLRHSKVLDYEAVFFKKRLINSNIDWFAFISVLYYNILINDTDDNIKSAI